MKNLKSYLPILFHTLLLFPAFLCHHAATWYIRVYGDIGFDAIMYTILSSLGGMSESLFYNFLKSVLLPAAVWTIAILLILHCSKIKKLITNTIVIMLIIVLLCTAASTVGLISYLKNTITQTKIFETTYVDPKEVNITFPEEKRNLIYIYLESMENTFFGESEGGAMEENIIPELYQLAEDYVNFSQNDTVGGFEPVSGTTWTAGALVGQTAGIPLKTPSNIKDMYNGYGKEGVFLPGITTLSDILHENGYLQSFMVGSRASFGGRRTYYKTHGTDCIYELSTARMEGIVEPDYFVWWGMEDKYLFEYAKEKITWMNRRAEPFAFTMLTVDTHHVDGYVCEYCRNEHEEQYENVFSCSSRQVAEFIKWIQEQDFYEDTTVIIAGDHLSMDRRYMLENVDESYDRRVYNCFINAAAETDLTEDIYSKNREFCTLDMFPTTLAAMGCNIEGDRLGLGTNLFSDKPTLIEEMGYEEFNSQIGMRSEYYKREFLREE